MRLLVDISGIMYSCAYQLGELSDSQDRPTGALYGTLNILGKLVSTLKPDEMVICYDGGSPRRKDLYPDYKTNRSDPLKIEKRKEVQIQTPILRGLLCHLPIVQVYKKGLEADDLIEIIATFCKHECVGIVTRDKDLYQLKTANHIIISPSTYREVELIESGKFYLIKKVLMSDTSDNIPGVPRVGEKTAERLIREHGSLKNIVRYARSQDGLGSADYKTALKRIKLNLKLVKLGELISESERSEIVNYYKYARLNLRVNEAPFLQGIKEYEFESIVNRLRGYLSGFRRMEKVSRHEVPGEIQKQIQAHKEAMGDQVRQTDKKGYAKRIRKTFGCAIKQPETTYAKRIRKVETCCVDKQRRRGDAKRTVRSDHGKKRLRGVGLCDSGVVKDEEFWKRANIRRDCALSILQDIQSQRGLRWLKRQSVDEIDFVGDVVMALRYKEYTMPRRYLKRLEAIYQEFLNEAPSWM